jgi:hypothetical protein
MWLLLLSCAGDPPADTPPASDSEHIAEADSGDVDTGGDDRDSAPPEDTAPPAETGAPEVPYEGLVINELMPVNDSTAQDERGDFPDWLELYNGGDESLALSRLTLWDTSEAIWTGGEGSLAPGGHLRLWADDAKEGGERLPFKLSGDGETVWLAIDGVVVDSVTTGELAGDLAWARHPDGGEWDRTIDATPGAANPAQPSESDDPSDTFFQHERINEIQIEVPEELLETLQDGTRTEVEGSLRFDGITLGSVGVRLKGSSTYRDLSGKAAFKVDINEFVRGQRLRGLKGLTFNNSLTDPSYVHDYLTSTVFRAAGYPAPRVGWTHITFNGEYFGLYLHIEDTDDRMLALWFDQVEQGQLWEGDRQEFGQSMGAPPFDYEEGPEPEDTTPLAEINEAVRLSGADDDALAEMGGYVDLDAFMRYSALESLTLHVDGYQLPHNYRVYHDAETDLMYWLPAGTDYTWTSTYFGAYGGQGNVFEFCLENEAWLASYNETLLEMADLGESLALPELFDELMLLVGEAADSDPRREATQEEIDMERLETRDYLETWPARMREIVEVMGAP